MLALRLARGARPAVHLRRLTVTAASGGTGFLLLCALGHALAHPDATAGSVLRLAWSAAPLAATVYYAVAVARTDPGTRPRPGLSAIGLGPGRLMAISAMTTALSTALGSALALLLFLHLRGDLGGLPLDGDASKTLAVGHPLPVPATLTLLLLVPVIASVTTALTLRSRTLSARRTRTGQTGHPGQAAQAGPGRGRARAGEPHGGSAGAPESAGETGPGARGGLRTHAAATRDGGGTRVTARTADGPAADVPGGAAGVADAAGATGAAPADVAALPAHGRDAGADSRPGPRADDGRGGPDSPAAPDGFGYEDGPGYGFAFGEGPEAGAVREPMPGRPGAGGRPAPAAAGPREANGQHDGPHGAPGDTTGLHGMPTGAPSGPSPAPRPHRDPAGSHSLAAVLEAPESYALPSGVQDPYPQPPAPRPTPGGLPWGVAVLAAGLAVETYASSSGDASGLGLPGGAADSPAGVLVGWLLTALGLVLTGPGLTHLCGRLLQAYRPGALRLLAGRVLQEEAGRIGRPLGVVCAVASGAYAMVAPVSGTSPGIGPLTTLGAVVVAGCTVLTLAAAVGEARESRAETTAALVRLGVPAGTLRTAAWLRVGALCAVFVPLTWTVAELAAAPLVP